MSEAYRKALEAWYDDIKANYSQYMPEIGFDLLSLDPCIDDKILHYWAMSVYNNVNDNYRSARKKAEESVRHVYMPFMSGGDYCILDTATNEITRVGLHNKMPFFSGTEHMMERLGGRGLFNQLGKDIDNGKLWDKN